jgi:hypothetical protein
LFARGVQCHGESIPTAKEAAHQTSKELKGSHLACTGEVGERGREAIGEFLVLIFVITTIIIINCRSSSSKFTQ